MPSSSPFCPVEKAAWAPPERLTVTEWAEKYRVLGASAAVPGPYRVDSVPYIRAVQDALNDDEHELICLQKPVQSSGSEAARNGVATWVDTDPGPTLIVFPDEKSTKEAIDKGITPMFTDTPKLKEHMTGKSWDMKKGEITLRSCVIYAGWAGSAQALASRSIRYVILDEVNKFPSYTGSKEADAVSLAKERVTTWGHRAKVYAVSTPTVPTGPITKAVEACGDVRDFCVPCPHCGAFLNPDWQRVTWEGKDDNEPEDLRRTLRKLEVSELVPSYECQECDKAISAPVWAEQALKGQWVSVGYPPGEHPRSKSVGFRLSGLVSPWLGLQKAAIKFTAARMEGIGAIHSFYNSTLGLPMWGTDSDEDPSLRIDPERLWELSSEGTGKGILPEWARAVVCGVDTGKRDHPYTVVAFGQDFSAQVLEWGVLDTGAEVLMLLDREWTDKNGRSLKIARMFIDCGGGASDRTATRTEEVFRLANADPVRIYACKGHGGAARLSMPNVTKAHTYRAPGDRHGRGLDTRLSMLDVGYYKDLLAGYIVSGMWYPYVGIERDYVMQMSSEAKVFVEAKILPDGTRRELWRWEPRVAGAPNHILDCSVYAVAAAHMLGVNEMREEPRYVADPVDYGEQGGGWAPPTRYTRGGSWI